MIKYIDMRIKQDEFIQKQLEGAYLEISKIELCNMLVENKQIIIMENNDIVGMINPLK